MMRYTIVAFYKFLAIEEPVVLKTALKELCAAENISGTILLAKEGINATLAGKHHNIQSLLVWLQSKPGFENVDCKFSYSNFIPFKKMKVAVKKEIITFNQPNLSPDKITGVPIAAENWNELISNPEILVLDTRNQYEVELGTFQGAVNPNTRHFSDFAQYVKTQLDPKKHKKIAMFCTGGIRCEKASSYLLQQGFENVYQLQGGILRYLEKTPSENSLWQGKCFIFDERITINES